MRLRTFVFISLGIILISGCQRSLNDNPQVDKDISIGQVDRRKPSELRIAVNGPDGRFELVVSDPLLIDRFCLQPLASAKESQDVASRDTLGVLKLVYGDEMREDIDLLAPFGHVRRGGRIFVADLSGLKSYMSIATRSAFDFMDDGRPSNTKVVFRGHKDRINAAAFSPDGKSMASVGDDPDIPNRSTELAFQATHRQVRSSV